jgi:threonine dehydrogenase-like Zn-dependent dehydrogenase
LLSVRVRGREHVEVVGGELATVGRGQVAVRVATTGICNSDLIAWYWATPESLARTGRVTLAPGHEAAGVVEAVGSDVKSPRVGQRVVVWAHCSGRCVDCVHVAAGGMFCVPPAGKSPVQRQRNGGQASVVVAEAWQCMPLPDALGFDDGSVLACAGGTAYQAARSTRVSAGERVVVLGAGPLGLEVAQVVSLLGAEAIVVDTSTNRLDLASAIGAPHVVRAGQEPVADAILGLTRGFGADVVFEATGSREVQRDCLGLARVGGRVCLLGFSADGLDAATLRPGAIITRQLTVSGSFVYPPTLFPEITSFATSTGWRPSTIVTDRFPLADAETAYRVAAERGRGKVLLVTEQ